MLIANRIKNAQCLSEIFFLFLVSYSEDLDPYYCQINQNRSIIFMFPPILSLQVLPRKFKNTLCFLKLASFGHHAANVVG